MFCWQTAETPTSLHVTPRDQGAPKGRQQKGETGPGTHIFADFCRFSLIFGSLCKSRDLGVADLRGKPQETADVRRKPQIFAGNRRKPICCLPFGALLHVIWAKMACMVLARFPGCTQRPTCPLESSGVPSPRFTLQTANKVFGEFLNRNRLTCVATIGNRPNNHCHHKHYRSGKILNELFPAILDRIIPDNTPSKLI